MILVEVPCIILVWGTSSRPQNDFGHDLGFYSRELGLTHANALGKGMKPWTATKVYTAWVVS